jgi:hypothetical protein
MKCTDGERHGIESRANDELRFDGTYEKLEEGVLLEPSAKRGKTHACLLQSP